MQMLKKLFNSDSKYYLELDEIKESEVVQTAVKTASKAADVVKEKASEVAQSQPVKEAVRATADVAESAQEKLTSAIATEEKPGEVKSAKAKPNQNEKTPKKDPSTASQNGKGKLTESAEETKETTPTSSNSGASSYDPPFWVAAMYNTNDSIKNSNGQVAEQTFATDNLMPIVTKYRRRPGGSLSKFRDMAKKAKTPRG